jgi:hypothetical protein
MFEISDYKDLHKNNDKIPEKYKSCSLHIAIEKADEDKNWLVFNELYKIAPEYLKHHLYLTSIFDYNYLKLSEEEKNKLFKL